MSRLGILLDQKVLNKVIRKKRAGEDVRQYNKACKENGLTPIYMSLELVNVAKGNVTGYEYRNGSYKKVTIPLPKVIYNRSMPPQKKMRERLKSLNKKRFVFNAQTRYSKFYIHRILQKKFSSNLPHTKTFSTANLSDMMKRFNSLYVKPQSGSVGEGIVKLTKQPGNKWLIQKTSGKQTASFQNTLQMMRRYTAKKPYLIQQSIPLAKVDGKRFDLRVNVQRGGNHKWRVTAMIAKVARKGSHVTNVYRGGALKKIEPLFQKVFPHPAKTRQTVEQFSTNVARHLGQHIRRFSDVGIDVGVSSKGKPYFIEANGRDQRYGLKILKMNQAYYRVHKTPIDYARSVMNRQG